jgi:SAM-dependent methyltransferase
MDLRRAVKRLWRMILPDSVIAEHMRRDWDDRARRNARHFVATENDKWNDREFFESGRTWIELYVAPDFPLICNGRSASTLRMLELGCGAGRMTRGFSETFGLVDAVDISSEMIQRGRTALTDCQNVRFHLADGKTLPMFGEGEFDFAFSGTVFQHIPRKSIISSYIREISRVLRPGCVFKFQVEGVPIKRRYTDTWHGAGLSESEISHIAKEAGLRIHGMSGAGTQFFWITAVKEGNKPRI